MNFGRRMLFLGLVITAYVMALPLPSLAQEKVPQSVYQDGYQGKVDYSEQTVFYNTNTHKYHKLSCVWAKRCTRHCIPVTRKEAIQKGGVPCKVCGG